MLGTRPRSRRRSGTQETLRSGVGALMRGFACTIRTGTEPKSSDSYICFEKKGCIWNNAYGLALLC